jgi:hypothetical protein
MEEAELLLAAGAVVGATNKVRPPPGWVDDAHAIW